MPFDVQHVIGIGPKNPQNYREVDVTKTAIAAIGGAMRSFS